MSSRPDRLLLLILLLPVLARAEQYTFTIGKEGPCKRKSDMNSGVDVTVTATFPRELASALKLYVNTGDDTPWTVQKETASGNDVTRAWTIARSELGGKDATFQLRETKEPERTKLGCDPVAIPAAIGRRADGGGGEADATDTTTARPIDLEAAEWWQADGEAAQKELRKRNGDFESVNFLVHYPSGDPAPPFPSSVSERHRSQIVLVAEKGTRPEAALVVTSCEGLQPFRVKLPKQEAGVPQAGLAPGDREPKREFQLVAYGPTLACGAGTLSYNLKLGGGTPDQVQSIRVRPVYHLAATAVYGFDMTSIHEYRVDAGKVAETVDRAGLGLRLGFTWFPFGVDYEDMRFENYLLNPVFAVDPTAPTENFLVGLAVTPTGGLSLIVGANFRKVTVLEGTTVGADFAGPGDLPTSKIWTRSGIGLFIGLSVDDDLFKAIGARVGAG